MQYINTNKLEKLEIKKENTYIILDFDKTITSFESKDSWAVCGLQLGEEFNEEADKIYEYYAPIEIDYTIDEKEKEKYIVEWYSKSINTYYEYNLTKEDIEKSIKQSNLTFRKGAKEFIKKANNCKIPLIILSAGIGNVIKEFLKKNECYFENMYIISNFIKFDEKGNMKKFDDKMIHTLNKSMEGHLSKEFEEKIKQKQHGILVGDLIDDTKMVPKEKLNEVITIGLLPNEINLDIYNKNFDIVLDKEDATFQNIEKLVFKNVSI